MSGRAERKEYADALEKQARRIAQAPLAWSELWNQMEPRTSQRRALLALADPGVKMLSVLGGNRAGKSDVLAQWITAQAGGLDARIERPCGPLYWVRRWLSINGLPESLIAPGPGRVWVGSPTHASAVEQIRPKLAYYAPQGTRKVSWDNKGGEGELHYPGGGCIVSKAYKQYDADPQTWEGANLRAIGLDEQPNSRDNLTAAISRLVDQGGKIVNALTPLRGKVDWYYRDLIRQPPDWFRVRHLWGEDNPYISQSELALLIAATPAWQRAARARGEFVSPEGAIYPLDHNLHLVDPFPIPDGWIHWQGWDWGARSPHVVWVAEDRKGDLYCYGEVAPRRSTTQPGLTDQAFIKMARDEERAPKNATVYRVADSESPGAIEEAAAQGLWLFPATKGPGSVMAGITLLQALMSTTNPETLELQRPRIFIMKGRCPLLQEELEGMRWAEERDGVDPHPDPACPDHGPDALRYIVQYRQSMGMR